MLQGIGALPTLLAAQVAFDKIAALALANRNPISCCRLPPRLVAHRAGQVSFHYQGRAALLRVPSISPSRKGSRSLSHRRQRFRQIDSGHVADRAHLAGIGPDHLLDGEPFTDRNAYLALFSAIFTTTITCSSTCWGRNRGADRRVAGRLQMDSKLTIEEDFIADIDLSQGQRKRVALLLAHWRSSAR